MTDVPHLPSAALHIEHTHPDLALEEPALRTLIHHILAAEECTLHRLNVVLADHDTVLALNREYLNHDYITDVLSFDLSDSSEYVEGDIYVDLDTAAERHDEFGASFAQEATRYVVHGLLHLIGYTDRTPEERATMRTLENRYLAVLAADPDTSP